MNNFKTVITVLVCTWVVQLWAGLETDLHRAARDNDVGAVRMLLNANARVDVTDNTGRTPLHYAVAGGHIQVVSKLVSKGANEKVADKDGKTPLAGVLEEGNALLARALFGGEVVDGDLDGGNSVLHEAVIAGREDVVGVLIEQHASVQDDWIDTTNGAKQAALHCAVLAGHAGIVNRLCNAGAKLDLRDKQRFTPLWLAATRGDAATCQRLINAGARVNDRASFHSATALHGAFDKSESGGNSNVEVVRVLLAAGALVNARSKKDETPLHWAVLRGDTVGCALLIRAGADVNVAVTAAARETPLHMALRLRHFDICRLLIPARANLSAQNRAGQTPLHVAVMRDFAPACALLLEDSSDVIDAKDRQGKTALDLAVMRGNHEMACLLIVRGAGSGAGCDKLLAQTRGRQSQAFRMKLATLIVDHGHAMARVLPTTLPRDIVNHVLLPYVLPTYQKAQQLHKSGTSRARKRRSKRKGAGPQATDRAEKKGRS